MSSNIRPEGPAPAIGDPHQADVAHAVKVAALKQLAREIGIAESLAVVAAAVMGGTGDETATPRELTAAAHQVRRAEMLDELIRLEQKGCGRAGAMIVARKFARDKLDNVEVESLSRQLRRWREKIPDTVRLPSPKSFKG